MTAIYARQSLDVKDSLSIENQIAVLESASLKMEETPDE